MNELYNYNKFSNAPDIVRTLCLNYSAFIIGGAAKYLLDEEDSCRDWDIVVPLSQWGLAQRLIPKNAIHNTFGGSKIILEKNKTFTIIFESVDIWSADISFVMENNKDPIFYIVHPLSKFGGRLEYGFRK